MYISNLKSELYIHSYVNTLVVNSDSPRTRNLSNPGCKRTLAATCCDDNQYNGDCNLQSFNFLLSINLLSSDDLRVTETALEDHYFLQLAI